MYGRFRTLPAALGLVLVVALGACAPCFGQPAPTPAVADPCAGMASLDACADDLAARMTLEEKASFLSGSGLWHTQPVARLGIPAIRLSDGPHGLRVTEGFEPGAPATAFPTGSALAASWDRQLLRRVGRALAAEARAAGVHVLLGPGLNLHRSPLGGRNFEYFSEDPVLAGELAAAYVRGVQGGDQGDGETGVAATVKHFVANHQETQRFSTSADVDPRALRELYLRAFEIAVTEGDPRLVMSAYNRVGGIPMSEHAGLLRGVLRTAWGFDGVVVSDWLAVDDPAAAHAAGLDLRMPGVGPAADARVVEAVRAGSLDEEAVDACVRRLLRLVLSFDRDGHGRTPADLEAHGELAREAALRSIVLLRNAGGLLPLDAASLGKVAVIGAWARTPRIQGTGSSLVTPSGVDTPYDEIARVAVESGRGDDGFGGVAVGFAPAYGADGTLLPAAAEGGLEAALRLAAAADVALVFVGTPPSAEAEGSDRADLGLAAGHDQLISAVAEVQEKIVVVLQNGGPVVMPWLVEVDAIVETWLGGQGMGAALADVLFGRAAPTGRLPMTFPGRIEQTATYPEFPSRNRRVTYGEGLFVGYRHFDAHLLTPLFPFGFGLGYGEFEYSDLRVVGELTPARSVSVSLVVKNAGVLPTSEAVQLYVAPRGGTLIRPEQTLADFARVELQPDEAKRVELEVEPRDVTVWDESRSRWILDAERMEIRVGTSSREIRLRKVATVVAPELPPAFDRYTLVEEWLAVPRGAELMGPIVDGLVAALVPPEAPDASADELRRFFLKLTGIKMVQLSGGGLDLAALDAMIRQVNGG